MGSREREQGLKVPLPHPASKALGSPRNGDEDTTTPPFDIVKPMNTSYHERE